MKSGVFWSGKSKKKSKEHRPPITLIYTNYRAKRKSYRPGSAPLGYEFHGLTQIKEQELE